MRFGLSYFFRNPPDSGHSSSYVYGAELEQIRIAESLGFDEIWTGEHHFVDDGWLPSPLVAAAAIAAQTSRVTVGTYATVIPLHHPIRLAEDCAVIDNISGGRFRLGGAIGWRASAFDTLGSPYSERGARLEETVHILRRCWTEESFSHAGRHFTFDDVRCTPKPVQQPIPILLGGTVQRAVRRAARLGDGWLSGHDAASDIRAVYVDALREAGKDPERANITATTRTFIWPTHDPERDWAMLYPHALAWTRTFESWGADDGPALTGWSFDDVMRAMFLVDTPEKIIDEIRTTYERGNFVSHNHVANIAGVPTERSTEALELLATEVIPALRGLGEEPVDAP